MTLIDTTLQEFDRLFTAIRYVRTSNETGYNTPVMKGVEASIVKSFLKQAMLTTRLETLEEVVGVTEGLKKPYPTKDENEKVTLEIARIRTGEVSGYNNALTAIKSTLEKLKEEGRQL